MDNLRKQRSEAEDGISKAGARVGRWVTQLIASVLILAVFIVMAYLVLLERIPGDALILFAGVILGYLLNSIKDLL